MKNVEEIISRFSKLHNQKNIEGMARFGINSEKAFGVPMPVIRKMAKEIKRDHKLALQLWETEIHEARILAALIADPNQVTNELIDNWTSEFDSWDVCDQCCMNLFDKTSFAYEKAIELSTNEKEFVKRAGFALMASLAMHDKKADDNKFFPFFNAIKLQSNDERNFVWKSVNWALRQIGKRSFYLNGIVIGVSHEILDLNTKAGNKIAKNAIKELTNEKILARIKR